MGRIRFSPPFRKEYLKDYDKKLIQRITEVGEPTVGQWLSGSKVPGLANLVRIAYYTGTNIDYLLYFTDQNSAIERMDLSYDRIRRLRLEKGFSQAKLADKCEVTLNMIAGIEKRNGKPSLQSLIKFRNVFGVSMDYLIGLTEYRTWESCIREVSTFSKYMPKSAIHIENENIKTNCLIDESGEYLIFPDGSKIACDDKRLDYCKVTNATCDVKREWAEVFEAENMER